VSNKVPECASIEEVLQKLAQEALGYTMICKLLGGEEGKDIDTRDRTQKKIESMNRPNSRSRPYSMFDRENSGNVYNGGRERGK
jgi:hypothetical protein